MKKLLILLFGVLVGLPALSQVADVTFQTQNVNGQTITTIQSVDRVWTHKKVVPAIPGGTYQWIAPGDTSYIFQPQAGQQISVTVLFASTSNPPTTLKQIIDNTGAVYKLADGTVVVPGVNVYNTAVWNSFNKNTSPNPAWCDVFYNDNCHFAYTTNLTCTFTFTGKQLKIFGEKSDNKGIIGFKVDGGTETTLDLYAATTTNNTQLIFDTGVLSQGTHNVVIRITGQKNAASSATNLLIDNGEVWE